MIKMLPHYFQGATDVTDSVFLSSLVDLCWVFFVSLDIMWKNSIAAICFCTRRIWLLKQKVLKVYQDGKKFLKPIFSSLFLITCLPAMWYGACDANEFFTKYGYQKYCFLRKTSFTFSTQKKRKKVTQLAAFPQEFVTLHINSLWASHK